LVGGGTDRRQYQATVIRKGQTSECGFDRRAGQWAVIAPEHCGAVHGPDKRAGVALTVAISPSPQGVDGLSAWFDNAVCVE
jgi:hypothetical protein